MPWLTELSLLKAVGKISISSNFLSISTNSTFKVKVKLDVPEPTWNLAGRLYVIGDDSDYILYSTQEIILEYGNLVRTNFDTGDLPSPTLVKFVFVPVYWVASVEYSYSLDRFIN